MPVYYDTFSDRSRYQLQLHIAPKPYNLAGNYTDVAWSLRIVETTENGTYSYAAAPWSATIHGQTWSGSSPYDFRSTDSITVGSGTKRVYHDANGYRTITFSGSVGGSTVIGSASTSGSLGLTRIPKVPPAPKPLELTDIKATSMLFRFQSTGDGGSKTDSWQLQYSESSSFSSPTTLSSSGTSTVTGLKSGTLYYFRARGHNTVGWGPWSSALSARTLAAFYYSDGTTWHSTEVYVSDGTRWHSVEVLISEDGDWLPAG
ncbi:minor tail protein [Microbacterium phage UtzChips]|nr:minor tail protein [Microbacterium phage UtzChips]